MILELSSGTIGLALAVLGAFAQFIRLEVASANQERRISALELRQKNDIEQLETKHKNEINQIHQNHTNRDKAIWDKIETIHSTLLTMVQALGRLEGKIGKSPDEK